MKVPHLDGDYVKHIMKLREMVYLKRDLKIYY